MLQEPKAMTERFARGALTGCGATEPDAEGGAPGTFEAEFRVRHVEPTRLSAPTFKTSLLRSFIDRIVPAVTADRS